MDFFKVLYQVSTSPSSFSVHAGKSPWKALFYYLLLALFLAFIFSFFEGCHVNKEIRKGCEFIYEKTGGFQFSDKGLTTIKTAGERKEYEIVSSRGKMRLDYLAGKPLSIKDMEEWEQDTLYGIILLNKAVLSWTKYDSGGTSFMVMYASLEDSRPRHPAMQLLEKEAFASFVTQLSENKSTAPLRKELKMGEYKDPVVLSRILEAFVSFGNLCLFLVQYVFLGLLSVLFFMIIQLFRLGPDGKRLTWKVNASITLFAALPALLAGAIVQALHIPLLDFQNVFLLVFFIYDILAFNAYYRSFRKGEDKEEKENTNDDEINKD